MTQKMAKIRMQMQIVISVQLVSLFQFRSPVSLKWIMRSLDQLEIPLTCDLLEMYKCQIEPVERTTAHYTDHFVNHDGALTCENRKKPPMNWYKWLGPLPAKYS